MNQPLLSMEPGPTRVDDRVIRAVCRPAVHHLSREFQLSMDLTCRRLQGIFRTSSEVVLLPATGRGGIEAGITSVLDPRRPMLVATNGSFGRMIVAIGRAVGAEVIELPYEAGERIRRADIARVLEEQDVGIVAMVHVETSTGMVNDLDGLGELAHRYGALLLVDAVSSLGGAELDVDDQGIDLCVSAAQKSIGGLGGTSFVAVSERAREVMDRRGEVPRSAYLDLDRWWASWLPPERGGRLTSGFRRLPWSMPTHPVFALEEACRIIVEEEGLAARVARHRAAARATEAVISKLGFPLLAPEGARAPTVTAFAPPAGVPAGELVTALLERHEIVVAGGLDELAGRIVRIGHMAETARVGPLLATLVAIAREAGPATDGLEGWFVDAWG